MKKYIIIVVAVVLCAVLAVGIFLLSRDKADGNTGNEGNSPKTVVEQEVELDFSGVAEESDNTQNPYDKDNDGYVDGWY